MTEGKFKAAMAMLAATFARALDIATIQGYSIGLSGLTDDELQEATAKALRTCKFMPSPGELRELAEGPKRITAAMQWANVRKVMDKLDVYGSPDFGPLVNAVIHALGGWKALCEKTIPELTWYQKDFERIYADFESKDLSPLRVDGHIGEFGKAPVWCALPGTQRLPLQLESRERGAVQDFVRQLADHKAVD